MKVKRLLIALTLVALLLPCTVHADDRWQELEPEYVAEGVVTGINIPSSNGCYWITLREDSGRSLWAKFCPDSPDGRQLEKYSRVRVAGPLVLDLAWLNTYGGEAEDWLEIVPVKGLEVIGPPELPTALDVTLGHIAIGDKWLHVVTAYNQTGKVQELCRAEYCVDIAPGDGVVWTWLLPERQDDLRGLAWYHGEQ